MALASEKTNRFIIRRPDDFHPHLRTDIMMRSILPYTVVHFARAMIMPNTSPNPILTAEDALEYRRDILEACQSWKESKTFVPLMTIQITDNTTTKMIREAKASGVVIAGKVYPKGATTNSHNGVSDFQKLRPVFEAMQEVGLVLSIHGQEPASFCLSREVDFLPTLEALSRDFPELKIVLEHISTRTAMNRVRELPKNVAATITAHHLVMTLDDVLSFPNKEGNPGINPHNYCQPILQTPEDREALVWAATDQNPKFFFGSDSAPHAQDRKENACGCAGVFSANVALSVLAGLFHREFQTRSVPQPFLAAANALENFVSLYGASFYGLPPNEGQITIQKRQWAVQAIVGAGVVPMYAGKTLEWQADDDW